MCVCVCVCVCTYVCVHVFHDIGVTQLCFSLSVPVLSKYSLCLCTSTLISQRLFQYWYWSIFPQHADLGVMGQRRWVLVGVRLL